MSAAYTPSEHVADEASALVDELWRALGGSESEAESGAEAGRAPRPESAESRPSRGEFLDPAAAERLADVLESASVGLRAFAVHLAALRSGERRPAGTVPAPCACEDADGGEARSGSA